MHTPSLVADLERSERLRSAERERLARGASPPRPLRRAVARRLVAIATRLDEETRLRLEPR